MWNESIDDINQEYELYKLEHPDTKRCKKHICIDIMRGKKFNWSYRGVYDSTTIEYPAYDGEYHFIECRDYLHRLVILLNKRQRIIIGKMYLGYTQREIASCIGVSRSYVSRLIKEIRGIACLLR